MDTVRKKERRKLRQEKFHLKKNYSVDVGLKCHIAFSPNIYGIKKSVVSCIYMPAS